jgi:hypothetical protein
MHDGPADVSTRVETAFQLRRADHLGLKALHARSPDRLREADSPRRAAAGPLFSTLGLLGAAARAGRTVSASSPSHRRREFQPTPNSGTLNAPTRPGFR